MTTLDVSVLIVSHGHTEHIRDCLSTLDASLEGVAAELILVDNLNEPNFAEMIGGIRPGMTIIQNDTRLGFGANMNKAARSAKGRVLLILNPDTKHHSGQIADAIEFLESDISHGVVAARLLNDDMTEQRNFRSFPSMWIAVLRGFGADRWQRRPRFYRKSLLEGMVVDKPTKVDWVYGSFMLIRRSVFEAFGGFDEGFFMYYEDVDLCFRLRKAGLSTYVLPNLTFMHHHFRTSSESAHSSHRKHHINSLVRYLWKSNGYLVKPQMPEKMSVGDRLEFLTSSRGGAKLNPLALAIYPISMRPMVQLLYMLSIAGATIVASGLSWGILSLFGITQRSFDDTALLISSSFFAFVILAQFMLQEFDSVRLGDARGRVIGVVESSLLAAFPVAFLLVGFAPIVERPHELFLLVLVFIAAACNGLAALIFARLVSSEGARIGVVIDSPVLDTKPPELPIGLQVVSEIFAMQSDGIEDLKARLSSAIRARAVDHILLVVREDRSRDMLQLVRALAMFDTPIWHAQMEDGPTGNLVQLRGPLRSRAREGLKRGFDLFFSLTALAILFVPMLIIAAAIKLSDSGPVFFGQPRLGRNQVPFMMLKFRSMHVAQTDLLGDKLTIRGDPRVTKLGAFLRKTSLDELPQLLNVVNGEMSIVGPRPLPVGFHYKGTAFDGLITNWHHRHRVRPGITGLAQLKGLRGTPDDLGEARAMMADRVKFDNLYINNWSIWLDFRIVVMTTIGGAFLSRGY